MVGAPGMWASCPCSTVHRLRMSEFRRDFESQSFGSPVRISRGKGSGRLVSVSARSKREVRPNGKSKESEDSGGFAKRSMLGLVALASQALLISSDAKADVLPPVEESERMRLEMSESIEKRVNEVIPEARIEDPATTVAPSLSNEMTAPIETSEVALEPQAGNQFGFLNGAVGSGIVGSGILGALYGGDGRAKTASTTAKTKTKTRRDQSQAVKGGGRLVSVRATSSRDVRRNAKPKGRENNSGFSRRSVLGLVALASPALLISSGAKSDIIRPVNESEKMRLEMLESIEKRVNQANAETRIEDPANTVAPPLSNEMTASVETSEEVVEPEISSTVQDEPVSDLQPSTPLIPAPTVSDAQPAVEASASGDFLETQQPKQFGNPFGFINGFGVVGSGILGALYWLEERAKTASKAALEEAKTRLDQSQVAMVTMKEKLENELYDQRSDSTKKLLKAEQERVAMADELTMLKSDAKELQLQLDSQKNVNQNLEKKLKNRQTTVKALEGNVEILEDKLVHEEQRRHALEAEVRNAAVQIQEKDEKIVSLEASIKEQENTEQKVRSELFATREALTEAEDRMHNLAKDLIVSQSCLEERGDTVQHLEKALADAISRAEETQEKLVAVRREMSELEESTRERLESLNAALLSKETNVRELNSELENVRSEAREAVSNVENFRQEVQHLEVNLLREQETVQRLAEELNTTIHNLQEKVVEAANFNDQLKDSRDELELLKKQKRESEGVAETQLRSLRESLQAEQVLTNQMQLELAEARASLEASSSEAKSFSEKLNDTLLVNKRMQEELLEVRQTADNTLATLNEEKKKVASAEKQFIETQKALAREEILVQSLRSEFSKAMDAMNDLRKHLTSLSKDLQDANVKIAALETEKVVLQQSMANERKTRKRFKDKAVHAELELAKLVQEKEGSVSKARKLEDELSSAEKEMGSLKQQMLVMENVIDSAELRMGSIQQVNSEVVSLLKKMEGSKVEQKQSCKHEMDRLKEQSKAASEITKELKNMKKLLSHFQQNLDEAELDRVEAEAALQAAVKRSNDDQQRAVVATQNPM